MSPPIGSARAGIVSQADAIPDSGQLHEYDARGLSLNDGDSVTSWPDNAGSDGLTTGTSPTYKTSRVNGQPAVVANRANSEYLTTSFSSTVTQPFDVFVVLDIDDDTVKNRPFGSTDPIEARTDSDVDTFAGSVLAGGSVADNPDLAVFSYNSASSEIRINQTTTASGDAGTSDMTATDVFRSANNPSEPLGGAIPYIAWYDADASGYVRSEVEQKLVDVFGPF